MLAIINRKTFDKSIRYSAASAVACILVLYGVSHCHSHSIAGTGLILSLSLLLTSLSLLVLAKREKNRIGAAPEFGEVARPAVLTPLVKACETSPVVRRSVDSFTEEPLTEEIAQDPAKYHERLERLAVKAETNRQKALIYGVLTLDNFALLGMLLQALRYTSQA